MKAKDLFKFKGVCHASMKKEKRFVEVHLCRKSSKVISSHYSFPARNSGYSNHIMAILYEIADYYLHSLKFIPLELACTSKIRQWGVPGEKYYRKAPVTETIIQKREKSRGITCTLYDPRRNKNPTVLRKSAMDLKAKLQSEDSRIDFSHCNFFMESNKGTSTDFGVFPTGPIIAQQLNPVEFDIKFLVNIEKSSTWDFSVQEFTNLPLKLIGKYEPVIPVHWYLSLSEMEYFNEIRINIENSKQLEEDKFNQKFQIKLNPGVTKYKITADNVYKMYIRQKQFESLVNIFLCTEEVNQILEGQIKHNEMYQPIAIEVYRNILRHKLHRDVEVRPAGFAIQPNLFWLVAISSGFISDKNIPQQFGIVLIKSPRAKRILDPFVLLQDSSFCVEKLDTDLPCLNQKHSEGYYEEIQMCMGLSGVSYADFVYHTFNGLVIVRVNFVKQLFQKLIVKLNSFYEDYVEA